MTSICHGEGRCRDGKLIETTVSECELKNWNCITLIWLFNSEDGFDFDHDL